jgi:hypothetical protein
VTILNDNNNCGECGRVCGAGASCVNGDCMCSTQGQVSCNGACVDVQTNPMSCGRCDHACPTGVACAGGMCQCPTGTVDCPDTACANLMTDPRNCGRCGEHCGGGGSATCMNGTCL